MIIDCHGHYTTEPKDLHRFRKDQTEAVKNKTPLPPRAGAEDVRRRDPGIDRGRAAQAAARARHRPDDLLAARLRHGPPHRRLRGVAGVDRDLQRPDPPRLHPVPEEFHRRLPAAADPGRIADLVDQGARALREGARHGRLQPQSRSVRRLFQRAAAHRQVVVSVLREDDRARRAGDDPRLRLLQSGPAHHRLVLPQRRHHGGDAAHPLRRVQGFPEAQADHPARRRRGAVPLGPLPRHRARQQAARARRDHGQQHLLRHLRLSPARHRPAHQGGAGRQHPVRLGDGRRGEGHRSDRPAIISTTPSAMSTARRTSPPPTSRRSSRATR